MIDNVDGYIGTSQFIDEMQKRNLSLEELVFLYEQYNRYNFIAKQEVRYFCSEFVQEVKKEQKQFIK